MMGEEVTAMVVAADTFPCDEGDLLSVVDDFFLVGFSWSRATAQSVNYTVRVVTVPSADTKNSGDIIVMLKGLSSFEKSVAEK